MEYTRVSLLKAALHEIVKSQPGHEDQVLSDAETELEPKQLRYIETRVRGALAGYARPMMESEGLSETSDHLREYFQNDALFVSVSRALATKLQGVQPRISPPGIFLFASASIGQAPAVVIAKLEHENGVRANRRRLADGRTTYIVQLLNDLLFTSASRIFKVGVFPAVTVGESVYGWVVDNQALGANVAHYFMSQFLGLELAIRPDVQTQRFFDLAEGWINSVQDPSKRANYQIALLAEMQSPKTSTSVTNFAEQFLELDDRDSFETTMNASGVSSAPFDKDTGLVKTKLANLRVDTESGLTVIAPPASIENGVMSIDDESGGQARIVIRDKIKKMSGRGRVPEGS